VSTTTTTTFRWIHNSSNYFVTLDCLFDKVWLTSNNRGSIHTFSHHHQSAGSGQWHHNHAQTVFINIDTLPTTIHRTMIVHPLNFYLEIRANVLSNHQLGLLERFDFTHNETEIIEGRKEGGESFKFVNLFACLSRFTLQSRYMYNM